MRARTMKAEGFVKFLHHQHLYWLACAYDDAILMPEVMLRLPPDGGGRGHEVVPEEKTGRNGSFGLEFPADERRVEDYSVGRGV